MFSIFSLYLCSKLHTSTNSIFLIHTGDIINVLATEYLSGQISDYGKIEFQIFDYDSRDKHYQVYYKDDNGNSWQIWIPASSVSLKWSYNFWLKRKKLKTLIESKRLIKVDLSMRKLKSIRDGLNEGRHYW